MGVGISSSPCPLVGGGNGRGRLAHRPRPAPSSLLGDIADQLQPSLSTVGLFRVSGSAARMKAAEDAVDRGETVSGSAHDLAGLLKLFFRRLPDPLLTRRLCVCARVCGGGDMRCGMLCVCVCVCV